MQESVNATHPRQRLGRQCTEHIGHGAAVTAEALISSGAIPESLVDAVVDAERYASGQRLVSLSPETDALWNDVWATFTAG